MSKVLKLVGLLRKVDIFRFHLLYFPDDMLSRKVDWSLLAQCDSFAVKNFVETSDRKAMTCVEPMRESLLLRKLENDAIWRDVYETVSRAYKNLAPHFLICHDQYGGYRLTYTGKTVVQPPFVFRRNPVGFIRPIPDGVVKNLSVMTSERTGDQLLPLGPIRFVNSDCNPNCQYDLSSDLGIVQLRAIKKIKPGDELFVKYGAEFFEYNCCLCRTCNLKLRSDQEEIAFDIVFECLLQEICTEVVNQIPEEQENHQSPPNSKRRRIKGRELIEIFNNLASSPLSCDGSPENFRCLQNDFFNRNCPPNKLASCDTLEEFNDAGANNSDSSHDTTVAGWEQGVPESVSPSRQSTSDSRNSKLLRASSPLRQQVSLSCSVSTITVEHSTTFLREDNQKNTLEEKLFPGSKASTKDASALASLFCSKFNLSDECSSTFFSIVKALLPEQNNFPSGFSHIKNVKNQFNSSLRILDKKPEQTFCVLTFRFQLGDIIKRSLRELFSYSETRRLDPSKDFNPTICPIAEVNADNSVGINLIFFTDGVNIKKSTFKKELWPIWVQIADLPPKLRLSRKNIVLAALVVSDTVPSRSKIVPNLRDEIATGLLIEIDETLSYKFFFKGRLLISDLGAKNHLLNMMKFNGFYGCHYCTAKGVTIGKTHAYYPFEQQGAIREPSINNSYIQTAETLSVKKVTNVVGVKGRSPFSDLIDGLPLTAPIDYMHCVLIGVFPAVLKLCYQSLSGPSKELVSILISELSCPREMISFSRKVRPLEEMSQYKANEMLNWLLYLSPIVFFERIGDVLYNHLTNLVFGIKLLLESSRNENVTKAKFFFGSVLSRNCDGSRRRSKN